MPSWAEWRPPSAPYTLGVEEEVMLLVPEGWDLCQRSDEVRELLPPDLAERVRTETHASALELITGVHRTAAGAAAELRALRSRLAVELGRMGLGVAGAGTHPTTSWQETVTSRGTRYQRLLRSLRELARREPTFSLHVHVGIPDPEEAARALRGVRAYLPLLLALSANSPFWQGRDSGLASARAPIFQAFPRSGLPPDFPSYGAYVAAIQGLIDPGAIPEPTFVWWDARLQPRLGTLEVRIMDAQVTVGATAALVALVQCLVCAAREGEAGPPVLADAPVQVAENRFLAARDGADAALIASGAPALVPVRELLGEVLARCAPRAARLGCSGELAAVGDLARQTGAARQRALAARGLSLSEVTAALARDFTGGPGPAPRAVGPDPVGARAA
jgi:carboxylate-amine ligase